MFPQQALYLLHILSKTPYMGITISAVMSTVGWYVWTLTTIWRLQFPVFCYQAIFYFDMEQCLVCTKPLISFLCRYHYTSKIFFLLTYSPQHAFLYFQFLKFYCCNVAPSIGLVYSACTFKGWSTNPVTVWQKSLRHSPQETNFLCVNWSWGSTETVTKVLSKWNHKNLRYTQIRWYIMFQNARLCAD